MGMDTMYDRLGKLLSETLEAGSVKFVKIERDFKEDEKSHAAEKTEDSEKTSAETDSESPLESEGENLEKDSSEDEIPRAKSESKGPEYRRPLQGATVYHVGSDGFDSGFNETAYRPKNFIYKKLTPELERAYRLLGIETSANADDVKKAYKEKIKYYHPDKYNENPVLQKVATDKTRQIVEAYKQLCEFLEV
ncbi:MAG: DnaJ domain-containing protein [Treponema sp.]|nr:DnaJ domain-containing protein [Treponema sp.]